MKKLNINYKHIIISIVYIKKFHDNDGLKLLL